MMSQTRTLAAIFFFIQLIPAPASARFCGDHVQGKDVPCACGDTVVSDVVLQGDPVLAMMCASDGLLVDARDADRGLTIDLHGGTLRGTGAGAGIWILNGGPGGARVISSAGRAKIDRFRDGVVGRGDDAVALVDGIVVSNSERDGVRLQGTDFEIRATEARDVGRDGFSLNGSGFRLRATQSLGSRRFGYFIMGQGGSFGVPGDGVVATASGKSGFSVMGNGHRFAACEASGNGEDGLRAMGSRIELDGCLAHDNRDDGITGTGTGWWLVGNRADDNGTNGLVVRGQGMTDAGGNTGARNRGERQQPALQCEIGNVPCVE